MNSTHQPAFEFNLLPSDIQRLILSELTDIKDLFNVREASKTQLALVDDLLKRHDYTMYFLHLVSVDSATRFIKNHPNLYAADRTTPEKIICHALTATDADNIDLAQLEAVLTTFPELNARVKNSVKTIVDILKGRKSGLIFDISEYLLKLYLLRSELQGFLAKIEHNPQCALLSKLIAEDIAKQVQGALDVRSIWQEQALLLLESTQKAFISSSHTLKTPFQKNSMFWKNELDCVSVTLQGALKILTQSQLNIAPITTCRAQIK